MRKFLLLAVWVMTLGVIITSTTHSSFALFENFKKEACDSLTTDPTKPVACDSTTDSGISRLLKLALNLLSLVVGVIAVIMIIIGGLKYITSSGDSAHITSAKNTIIYAIIGLVIVAMSQFIVRFVLSKTTALPKCPAGKTVMADGSACSK